MLFNPLETLSYYKHREQQCQPYHVLTLTDPLPFHRHTHTPSLILATQHRNACTALVAKTLRASPGKQILPPRQPPNTPRHSNKCNCALYSLLPRVIFPHPPALQLKNRMKGMGFFSVVSGAAELALAGGILEALLT